MPITPTRAFRIPNDLWALIEQEAIARQISTGLEHYPRTRILNDALRHYFGLGSGLTVQPAIAQCLNCGRIDGKHEFNCPNSN